MRYTATPTETFAFFALTLLFSTYVDCAFSDEYSRQELFQIVQDQKIKPGVNAALPRAFRFPDSTRDSAVFGIDTSHHTEDSCDCKIDWQTIVTKSVNFAYLKATQGKSYIDPTFERNWQATKPMREQNKLYAGAYHFITADDDPAEQLKNFQKAIGSTTKGELPPSLDLEWDLRSPVSACHADAITVFRAANGKTTTKCDFWSLVPPDVIIERVLALAAAIKAARGESPVLYTNAGWWRARIHDQAKISRMAEMPIWIADYSTTGLATEVPTVPNKRNWEIWQFSENAVLNGGNLGKVDASIFPGRIAKMRQVFHLGE